MVDWKNCFPEESCPWGSPRTLRTDSCRTAVHTCCGCRARKSQEHLAKRPVFAAGVLRGSGDSPLCLYSIHSPWRTIPYLYLNTFNGFISNQPSLTQAELLMWRPGNLQGCPALALWTPSLAPKCALLLSNPLVMGGTITYLINKLKTSGFSSVSFIYYFAQWFGHE